MHLYTACEVKLRASFTHLHKFIPVSPGLFQDFLLQHYQGTVRLQRGPSESPTLSTLLHTFPFLSTNEAARNPQRTMPVPHPSRRRPLAPSTYYPTLLDCIRPILLSLRLPRFCTHLPIRGIRPWFYEIPSFATLYQLLDQLGPYAVLPCLNAALLCLCLRLLCP